MAGCGCKKKKSLQDQSKSKFSAQVSMDHLKKKIKEIVLGKGKV